MNDKQTHNMLHSVFFKIALIVFFASLVMILFLGGIGSYFLHHQIPANLQKSFARYTKGIVEEIGIPPSAEQMEKTAADYGLIILYKGPGFEYATGKPFPPGKKILAAAAASGMGTAGRYLYKTEVFGGHSYLIASTFFLRQGYADLFLLFLALFLAVLFFIVHQVIRRILRPIKHLVIAVERVKAADFSYRIPAHNKDELGMLCRSFNGMTGMLEQMILAREKLLLDVSHELRSPVTRMKIGLELLKDPKAKENLGADLYEMEKMIEEILEGERIGRKGTEIPFENIELNSFIEELLAGYRGQAQQVEFRKESESILLYGNRAKLKMLFRNLLENALRYSQHKPVAVITAAEQGEVLIEIADQGEGIAAEALPFVFEPFYRADFSRSRETGGYGLGLYLCRKIVELHNGTIDIESTLASGTRVSVRFKAAAG